MLFSRRKKTAERAALEAAGKSLWTAEFGSAFRVRLMDAFGRAGQYSDVVEILDAAGRFLAVELGRHQLVDGYVSSAAQDLQRFVHACDNEVMPDVIEVLARGASLMQPAPVHYVGDPDDDRGALFESQVRDLLYEERLCYDLVQGVMIERGAEAMHENVILPALTLLAGRKGFERAEVAYQKALKELAKGDPADSITDAARAVQEAMEALGWNGTTIGRKFDWARSQGLLSGHDAVLVKSLEGVVDWVAAERSERGDAHKETQLSRADAQLTVNVAGALILRLAEL